MKLMAALTMLILLFLTLMLGLIMYGVQKTNQLKKEKEQEKKMSLELSAAQEQYEHLLENLSQIKGIKHDMKHHFLIIEQLLRDQKIPELQTYIEKISGLSDFELVPYGENYVISVMAAYFEGQAKKEGIRFACKVQVPGTIEIPAEVLTAILGNMWQNALEACERMTQQERYIRTRILYQDGRLIVRCENSFAGTLRYGKRGSRLLSTKGAHRGQGLSNIRRLVKQQGGNCSIEQAKDSFLLTVVLTEEREYQSGGEWNVSNCDM